MTHDVTQLFTRIMLDVLFGDDIGHVELTQEVNGVRKQVPIEIAFPQLIKDCFNKLAHPIRGLTTRLNAYNLGAFEREHGRNCVALRQFIADKIEKAKKTCTKAELAGRVDILAQ